MTENKQDRLNIIKNSSEISWFIADRWFRVIEFSLILATLTYFEKKINSIPLSIIYWLSWAFFWSWFEDISKFIIEMIYANNKLNKHSRVFVWILCTAFVMAIYLLIISATNSIITKEHL